MNMNYVLLSASGLCFAKLFYILEKVIIYNVEWRCPPQNKIIIIPTPKCLKG